MIYSSSYLTRLYRHQELFVYTGGIHVWIYEPRIPASDYNIGITLDNGKKMFCVNLSTMDLAAGYCRSHMRNYYTNRSNIVPKRFQQAFEKAFRMIYEKSYNECIRMLCDPSISPNAKIHDTLKR
jgi:hypothetical protein